MTKKKGERKYISPLPDILKSDVAGKKYPIDIVKEAYVKSDRTPKRFARLYGLTLSLLEKFIAAGEWDRVREEHRQRLYNTFNKERDEILDMKQALVHRIEKYKLIELEQELDDLEAHFEKYSDFFVRDSEDEILRDGFGNPMKRRAVSKKDMEFLKDLEAAREINKKVIEERQEERVQIEGKQHKQLTDGKTIDVDSYGLFEDEDETT